MGHLCLLDPHDAVILCYPMGHLLMLDPFDAVILPDLWLNLLKGLSLYYMYLSFTL